MTKPLKKQCDELLKTANDCPNCPNQGWYEIMITVRGINGEPEPERGQEQCQFCYEHPNSRFNIVNRIKELNGKP